MLWFLGSGVACILLLAWASIRGLGGPGYRLPALLLLGLTAVLAALPSGLFRLRRGYEFPINQGLLGGATLCLAASVAVLLKMRRVEGMQTAADLALAACLNLWLATLVVLSPFSSL